MRAALLEEEQLRRQTPLTVETWNRHLACGAALGAAPGGIGALPMGVESDTHARRAYGGSWRPVRITYPRLWPPGWGTDPLLALVAAAAAVVGGALFLYLLGAPLLDVGPLGLVVFLVACAFVVVASPSPSWRGRTGSRAAR